jgi:integrase
MPNHLILKGTTYHVRLAIPEDVRPFLGNKKIYSKSLGTGNKARATVLSYPLLEKWKLKIEQVRRNQYLPVGAQDEVYEATEIINSTNTQMKRALIGEAPPELPETDPQRLELLERMGVLAALEEFYSETEPGLDRDIQVNDALAEFFIDLIPQAYARLYPQASPEELLELTEISSSPESYKAKSPITPRLTARWKEHLHTQFDNQKTIDSNVSRIRRIAQHLTDTGLALEFETIHEFLINISNSASTRKQYIWSGKAFWEWATRYDVNFKSRFGGVQNPFLNHVLPKSATSRTKHYIPFERTDVELLHSKAIQQGQTDLADIIKLGAYTGCRLEELGRLKIEDIIYQEEQPIAFRVAKSKTTAGERVVPIHPKLIDLILCRVKNPGQGEYLFNGGKNKYGNRFDGISKKFGRLKKSHGFSEEYSFHSIRKTTATQLHQANVSVIITPFILGHETNTITYDLYSNGPSLEQMIEAIKLIDFTFQ